MPKKNLATAKKMHSKSPSEQWLLANKDKLGSQFELLFVQNVLTKVDGLNWTNLSAQMPFTDRDGKSRFCDFTLVEGDAVKIAIEIDGYDKRGTGQGMTHEEFIDWQRRQASLVSMGWRVIRFANRDVRDIPERCAEHLNLLIRNEKALHNKNDSLNLEIEKLRNQIDKERKSAKDISNRISSISNLTEAAMINEKKVLELKLKNVEERNIELQKSLEKSLSKQNNSDSDLTAAEKARLAELEMSNKNIDQLVKSNSSIVRSIILLFILILGLSGFFYFHLTNTLSIQDTNSEFNKNNQAKSLLSNNVDTVRLPSTTGTIDQSSGTFTSTDTLGQSCSNPILWSDTGKYIGQSIYIYGPVTEVTFRDDLRGKPTWINLGRKFPDSNRFTILIWGDNRPDFTNLDNLLRRQVCVFGTIQNFRGTNQVEIKSKEQLTTKP